MGIEFIIGIDKVPELAMRLDLEEALLIASFIPEISAREVNKDEDDGEQLRAEAEGISRFRATSARASMLDVFMTLFLMLL